MLVFQNDGMSCEYLTHKLTKYIQSLPKRPMLQLSSITIELFKTMIEIRTSDQHMISLKYLYSDVRQNCLIYNLTREEHDHFCRHIIQIISLIIYRFNTYIQMWRILCYFKRFGGTMAEMLVKIDLKIYMPYIKIRCNGEKILYATLKKALYGYFNPGILF